MTPASLLVLVSTVVTAATMRRVFDGWEFLPPLVVAAAMMHVLAWSLRRVRVPGWAAAVLLPVGGVVTLANVFAVDTLAYRLPTSATWQLWRDQFAVVVAEFPTAVAPVPGEGAFLTLAGLGVVATAMLADSLAFRLGGRAEALAPATVLFVLVGAVSGETWRVVSAVVWIAVALTTLAALRALHDGRSVVRSLPGGSTAALASVAVAALVAPLLPGAGEPPLLETRRLQQAPGAVFEPLVDVRNRLVDQRAVEMFTVSSAFGRYWRIAALDEFDGTVWRFVEGSKANAVGTLLGEQLVQQRIEISGLRGDLVPAAARPVDVSQDERAEIVDLDTIVASPGLRAGDVFNVASDVAVPTAAQARAASVVAPPDSGYRALPVDFPQPIVELARAVVAGSPTPYDAALALQEFFQTSFVYDLDVPAAHSDDAMLEFLRVRRGYCEQFSATFAAMARAVGLPARVAVGFTTGVSLPDGSYRVEGRHAHAWAEVWFDGLGWVLFEPTPGRGAPGSEDITGRAAAQDDAPLDEAASPTTTTVDPAEQPDDSVPADGQAPVPPDPASGLPPGAVDPGAGAEGAAAATADGEGWGTADWAFAVVAAMALWLLLMPRAVRRLTRLGSTPGARVIAAWHGAVAGMRAGGAPAVGGATPLEYAAATSERMGVERRHLEELAGYATRAVYDPAGVSDAMALRAAVLRSQVLEAVDESLGPFTRLRVRVDPTMVRRRLRG